MPERATVSAREWRWAILFAAAVMVLTTIPYVAGWLVQDDDWQFGGLLFGADDGYSYLAKMRLGARGDWLFTVRYTSEPHDGALLFLPYILLGHLTALVVDSQGADLTPALAVTFHVARIVCGFGLLLVAYRFAAAFLRRPHTQRLALVLIALGGGLGWLLALAGQGHLFGSLPVDFYVPEGYSFLILFGLPHLALARSGLLGGFLLLFGALGEAEPHRWLPRAALAGLCWAVMGLCVPFYVAVLYALLGAWGLAAWIAQRRFPWALFRRAAVGAAVALPVLLYSALVFATNDVLAEWSSQNRLPSPHVLHAVAGYVVLAIPALWGIRWAWRKSARRGDLRSLLLVAWVVSAPVLVYLPVNVQRRLAEGVIVPLVVLAVAGLRLMSRQRRRRALARNVVLALALPTALLLWLGGLVSALAPDRPLFRPRAEIAALERLDAAAPRDAVVLSSKETGNVVPAYTDLIAYVGHGPETIDSGRKEQQAQDFFAGTLAADERRALLDAVDVVFYGPLEVPEDGARSLDWAAGLRLMPGFAPDDPYVVYEVPHD